jgi:hypothetical protein
MNGHGRRKRSGRTIDIKGKGRRPEKLVDGSRTIRELGTTHVDNGATISADLATQTARKAFRLRISVKNTDTEAMEEYTGQAGLIRGTRLTESPPVKKVRLGSSSERPRPVPAPVYRSRFEAIPTTALHNVVTETNSKGVREEYKRSTLIAPDGSLIEIDSFSKAGYEPTAADSFVIRRGEDGLAWEYGHDTDYAGPISNEASPFTKKEWTFEKIEREDYRFEVGQKIGISVYRDFEIEAGDTGAPDITHDSIQRIFGRVNQVNIYTGEITRVCEGGTCFEHNVNTFAGCSGAIVFLLDRDQEAFGVVEDDYGKAIAVHVGGDDVGTVRNFAFTI